MDGLKSLIFPATNSVFSSCSEEKLCSHPLKIQFYRCHRLCFLALGCFTVAPVVFKNGRAAGQSSLRVTVRNIAALYPIPHQCHQKYMELNVIHFRGKMIRSDGPSSHSSSFWVAWLFQESGSKFTQPLRPFQTHFKVRVLSILTNGVMLY